MDPHVFLPEPFHGCSPGDLVTSKTFPTTRRLFLNGASVSYTTRMGGFARTRSFFFFAINYIIRHRNSSSGKFFIDKFQRNVPDTLDELKDEIRNGNTSFVNHLMYYNKRIKGSSTCCFQTCAESYAWINQHIALGIVVPTFLITLSKIISLDVRCTLYTEV